MHSLHSEVPDGPAGRTILGIEFFQGGVEDAVRRMHSGGLLVVPAAPALKDVETDLDYRYALLGADLVLADSAFMVLVWNWLQRDNMKRLSGLTYLRRLLLEPEVRGPGGCFWIMATEADATQNVAWLSEQGIDVPRSYVSVAPMYTGAVVDPALLAVLEELRPRHIVLTIGGGKQEKLGFYLKQNLSYRPAIHCIGAAIAFLSGAQVHIPVWADRFYLGWLFRTVSRPRVFLPRYWAARRLFGLMRRWRARMPEYRA